MQLTGLTTADMLGSKGGIFMDIRVLRYFLAVAREENISGAAEYLHSFAE